MDINTTHNWNERIGRWMLLAYDKVFLHWVHYPFISGFLAILFFTIAYVAWLDTHKDASFTAKLIFGSLAISFPTFGHMLKFYFKLRLSRHPRLW